MASKTALFALLRASESVTASVFSKASVSTTEDKIFKQQLSTNKSSAKPKFMVSSWSKKHEVYTQMKNEAEQVSII